MADFCKECSIEIFNDDCGDLAGITTTKDMKRGIARLVLCEGCGPILVDPEGKRIRKYGEQNEN